MVGPPFPSGPMHVQCLGNEPRGRGFAHPADPRKQEGMGDSAAGDGVAQSLDHRVLADQLGKGLRTIFAGEDAIVRLLVRLLRLFWKVEPEARRFVVHGGGLRGDRRLFYRHPGLDPGSAFSFDVGPSRE